MKKILLAFTSILLIQACDLYNDEYHNISFLNQPYFEDGDTMVFESNTGLLETFVINVSEYYDDIDDYDHYQRISIDYNNSNNVQDALQFHIGHYASYDNVSTNTTFSLPGNSFPIITKETESTQFSIGERLYVQVYILKDTTFPTSVPHTVYYTHHYGILRYDYSDTLYYELVNSAK